MTSWTAPPEHRGLRTEERPSRAVDPLHPSLGVGHDHGVIEGIDRRFGRLLRDEYLSEVRLSELPNPPRHLVELGRQHAELVAGPDLHDRVEVARGHAAGRRRQLPHRLDDAVRQENCERDAADDERHCGSERRQKPPSSSGRCFGGFSSHRILIEGQQAIALTAQLSEHRLELAEVLVDRRGAERLAPRPTSLDVEQESIEAPVVIVAGPADRLDDVTAQQAR